jgi:hypothetical protein
MDASPTCVSGSYPGAISAINAQIAVVFESQSRNPASNKITTISNLFTKRNFKDATKQTFEFLDWLGQRRKQGKVIGTEGDITKLSSLLFCAIGASGPSLPAGISPNDPGVGVGFYDPNSKNPTLVRTNNAFAGTQIQPGTLLDPDTHQPVTQTVTITVFRLPDFPGPLNTGLTQFPPFWDFNATLPDGRKPTVNPNNPAIVGMCISTTNSPPPEAVIGHNTSFEGFELLTLVTVPFALTCGSVPTTGGIGMTPMRGTWGLASVFSGAQERFAQLAQAVFLPEQAWAAMLVTGTIGGKATGYSPFGAVDPTSNQNGFVLTNDPGDNPFWFANQTLETDTCSDGCFVAPTLVLKDPTNNDLNSSSSVPITVTLVKLNGATGNLLGSTSITATPSLVSPGLYVFNPVEFSGLAITEFGRYALRFSASGFRTLTSAPFDVYQLKFTRQPLNHNVGDALGEVVSGFTYPLVQVSALDAPNHVATTLNDIDIEMRLGTTPTEAWLNGSNTTVTLTAGVANFTATYASPGSTDGLSINSAGNGFTLKASRAFSKTFPDLSQAESAPFNITNPGF